MMMNIDDLCLAQEDGSPPTTLAAGSAPGESGVSVLNVRFRGGMHLTATLRRHLICFQWPTARQLSFGCRIAGRALSHQPPAGSLAICPAGIDCAADADGSVDAILVAIDPGQLALAAAEDSAPEAQLIERFSGCDQALVGLARTLACESAGDYPNGPLFWNEAASAFIDGLVERHTSRRASRARGMLGKDVLARLKDLRHRPPRSIHRCRSPRSNSGTQSLPLHPSVHSIGRHDSTPLHRASAIAACDRAGSRRTIGLGGNRRPHRLCRSESTCRDGCAAFTAFFTQFIPSHDQNSRNLQDQSPATS